MKIEPNMYVRIDDGYIFKAEELLEKGKGIYGRLSIERMLWKRKR